MGQAEQDCPFRVGDILRLLQAARLAALRQASEPGLTQLLAALELAREASRATAIREVCAPKRQTGDTDPDPGFASLFAALRCARFEIKRRQSAESRRIASIGRDSRRRALLPKEDERQPMPAQQPQLR